MNKSALTLCLIFVLCATSCAKLGSNTRQLSWSWPWQTFRKYPLYYNTESGNYMLSTRFAVSGSTTAAADAYYMLPSLSNTDNWVVNNGNTGFTSYSTFAFTQTSTTTKVGFESAYFTGTGPAGTAVIQVPAKDGSTMTVGSPQTNSAYAGGNVIRATSVNSVAADNFGAKAYGVLGLGLTNLAANGMNTVFSVYLDKYNRNDSILSEDRDLAYSRDIFATARWNANGSWVTTGNINVGVGKTTIQSTSAVNLLFDMNVNVTGFPSDIYYNILTTLANYGVTGCSTDMSQPTCTFNGRIKDLPWIYINNVGGSESIPIPPKVYIAGYKSFNGVISAITLNFKLLAKGYTSPNGVSNNNHATDIILDASILSYYLAVFDTNGVNGEISLYVASGSAYWWVYFGWPRWAKVLTWIVTILVVLSCVLGCVCRRRRQKAAAPAEAA